MLGNGLAVALQFYATRVLQSRFRLSFDANLRFQRRIAAVAISICIAGVLALLALYGFGTR